MTDIKKATKKIYNTWTKTLNNPKRRAAKKNELFLNKYLLWKSTIIPQKIQIQQNQTWKTTYPFSRGSSHYSLNIQQLTYVFFAKNNNSSTVIIPKYSDN